MECESLDSIVEKTDMTSEAVSGWHDDPLRISGVMI